MLSLRPSYGVAGQGHNPASTTMTTEWNLPLLAWLAAVRHGGLLVPGGDARDARTVPPMSDDRLFWLHQLVGLASKGSLGDALDALALARLVSTDGRDRRRSVQRVLKTYVRSVVRVSSSR